MAEPGRAFIVVGGAVMWQTDRFLTIDGVTLTDHDGRSLRTTRDFATDYIYADGPDAPPDAVFVWWRAMPICPRYMKARMVRLQRAGRAA